LRLRDRVAIVTGSSRGIGKAIALAMAREGADVVVAARTESAGQSRMPGTIHETAEMIRALGRWAVPIKVDISSEDDTQEMVRRALADLGRVDILVNNAGVFPVGPFADLPIRHWDLAIRVNLRGTFLCTKAVLPHMMERKSGSIINISSWMGKGPSPGYLTYGVTKAGIESLTMSLAEELREYNISVNSLSPSTAVDTEGLRYSGYADSDMAKEQLQQPEPPEAMAEVAVFLATQNAGSLTGKSLVSLEWKSLQAQG
jgi:citronellol/citronellal dehydrogenase